ncbi:MAG TPA: FtsQ-type POTRA domain-containing protein [Bdellovibrionales bacterium]|nr:FtsQ-type POTRA domain-containing protein [Bdellovibrionales bacterium]
MKRLVRFAVFMLVNLVLFGAVAALMYRSGLFKIAHVQLIASPDSSGQMMFDEYRESLERRLAKIKGVDIWEADVGGIAAHAESLPWVRKVSVRRIFPSTIRVEVEPKAIAAVIATDKGRLLPLSNEADLLPPLPATKFPDVPVIRDRKIFKDEALRKKTVGILRELPDKGLMGRANIAEISADQGEEFWLSLVEDNLKVKIGSTHVPLRAARVEKVLEYLRSNNMQARVIDADFSKKVVVKLRKDR